MLLSFTFLQIKIFFSNHLFRNYFLPASFNFFKRFSCSGIKHSFIFFNFSSFFFPISTFNYCHISLCTINQQIKDTENCSKQKCVLCYLNSQDHGKNESNYDNMCFLLHLIPISIEYSQQSHLLVICQKLKKRERQHIEIICNYVLSPLQSTTEAKKA